MGCPGSKREIPLIQSFSQNLLESSVLPGKIFKNGSKKFSITVEIFQQGLQGNLGPLELGHALSPSP
jgi:hypothetical protein